MTEEREKELAEKIHGDCIFRGAVHQHDVVQQTKLILRIVIAEVQKEEGIEAIIIKMKESAEWKIHRIASTGEWREGYKAAIEWVIMDSTFDATWLKEQGK